MFYHLLYIMYVNVRVGTKRVKKGDHRGKTHRSTGGWEITPIASILGNYIPLCFANLMEGGNGVRTAADPFKIAPNLLGPHKMPIYVDSVI